MGNYQIQKGKIKKAVKAFIYMCEGCGKSTLASQMPGALFIDTEGSTDEMNVDRLPAPTSWAMLLDEIDCVAQEKMCKTLIIDTIDWAERLCIDNVLKIHNWNGIEDAGWGNGYKYVNEEFARLFPHLDRCINAGINVVLLGHVVVSKFEMPDDQGSYDRYTPKLINSAKCSNASLVKEWADMVLFGNFKTVIIKDDKTKKSKGLNGQERILYTQRTAAWDAKNRYDLPFSIPMTKPFDFSYLPMFKQTVTNVPEIKERPISYDSLSVTDGMEEEPPRIVDLPPIKEEEVVPLNDGNWPYGKANTFNQGVYLEIKSKYKELWDLMYSNELSEEDIRKVSAHKGYFPLEASIVNYPSDYIAHIMTYKDEFIKLAKSL